MMICMGRVFLCFYCFTASYSISVFLEFVLEGASGICFVFLTDLGNLSIYLPTYLLTCLVVLGRRLVNNTYGMLFSHRARNIHGTVLPLV